jgi:threonyl-tRNA synthetase
MTKEITITLPDGGHKKFEAGIKPVEIARSISKGLADSAVVARVDGKLIDLMRPIEEDSTVAILTPKNPESLVVYRNSSAHLLALAVTTLFPEVQLGIGPPIENGFFYDFYREQPFTAEDWR